MRRLRSVLELPEANVAIFSLLLNFPWEMLQAPFFEGMTHAPHWQAVKFCTAASVGDAFISLLAYWSISAASRSRLWLLQPTAGRMSGFVAVGLAITIVGERLAVGPMARWAYSAAMPVIPWVGVGLMPVLQWMMLPPLIVWFSTTQIAGRRGPADLRRDDQGR